MDKRLEHLFQRYLTDSATESEKAAFWEYVNNGKSNPQLETLIQDSFSKIEVTHSLSEDRAKIILQNVLNNLDKPVISELKKNTLFWTKIAAMFLITVAV